MKAIRKSIVAVMAGLVLALAVCALCLGRGTAARADGDDYVNIPDPTLKALIIDTLELSSGNITPNDMKRLRTLDTPENDPAKQITDLTGLEYAENLLSCDLDYNKITDLTPLANLTKLETLNISYNNGAATGTSGITDISCLADLTALKSFSSIGNGGVEEYSVVGGFPELTYLNLSICGIRDISFVKSLTKLEKLYLSFNEISDVYPLAGHTTLQTLALGNNKVADIKPLATCTGLTQLTAEGNYIDDFAPVLGLTALQRLDVSRNFLSSEQAMDILTTIQGDVIVSPVADESKKAEVFTLPAASYALQPGGTATVALSGATFYSTDTAVATVSAEGTITAAGEGACYVVVQKDGFARGVTVTVSANGGNTDGNGDGTGGNGGTTVPEKGKKKCGCGSSVAATAGGFAGIAAVLAASAVLVRRKKTAKEDRK